MQRLYFKCISPMFTILARHSYLLFNTIHDHHDMMQAEMVTVSRNRHYVGLYRKSIGYDTLVVRL